MSILNSGVYLIKNIVNGHCYVGSAAKGFDSRWQKHVSDLKRNVHRNSKLQKAYAKYGILNLRFEVIARCPAEYVLKLEQFFIDALKPYYNICKVAGNSRGVKRSEEYKKNMSMVRTGSKMPAEAVEKLRLRMLGNTYTKGLKRSSEVIEKTRLKQLGSKRSAETKEKISVANSGRTISKEHRDILANSRIKYEYVISDIHNNTTTTTTNLRLFAQRNNLHDGHLNDTWSGTHSNGKSCLQHKGFKIIQKTLLP